MPFLEQRDLGRKDAVKCVLGSVLKLCGLWSRIVLCSNVQSTQYKHQFMLIKLYHLINTCPYNVDIQGGWRELKKCGETVKNAA